MGKLSAEQGDRLLAAAGPGKNRYGRPHGSGDGKRAQPWEAQPQQTNSLGLWGQRKGRQEPSPWGPWENEDATEIQTPPETVVIGGERDRRVPVLRACCRHGEKVLRVGRHF